jgi:hypothetical protein
MTTNNLKNLNKIYIYIQYIFKKNVIGNNNT